MLHEFEGGPNDGMCPYGSLILDSAKLYGMTRAGGAFYDYDGVYDGYPPLKGGTAFSMDTDGNNFALLHHFGAGSDDGEWPFDSFILEAGKLYGMTYKGGHANGGVVFSMDTDGSNFTLLHEFAWADGAFPRGNLTLSSGRLYGMTHGYSATGVGDVIFSMDTDGSTFTLLHEFVGGNDDGSHPSGTLVLDPGSGELYGMTWGGGDDNMGTIFVIPEPATLGLLLLGGLALLRRRR